MAVAVAGTVLYLQTWRYGELEPLAEAPRLAGWLEWLPFPGVAGTAALLVACVGLGFGWRPRTSAVTVSLLGLWVLGVPQMFGKVTHYHHLIWLPLLLAVPKPSVRAAQVLMASCYLFPGLSKLSVTEWWTTDQLRWQTRAIGYWNSWTPPIDLPGWVWQPLAVVTVALEIGFLFLTLTRWHRHAAVLVLGFHLSVWWLTGLIYWPMLIVFPIFFLRSRPVLGAGRWVVGVWLALLAIVSLPIHEDAWPVAAYPTFTGAAQSHIGHTIHYRYGEEVHPGKELAPWGSRDVQSGLSSLPEAAELLGACRVAVDVDLTTMPATERPLNDC